MKKILFYIKAIFFLLILFMIGIWLWFKNLALYLFTTPPINSTNHERDDKRKII